MQKPRSSKPSKSRRVGRGEWSDWIWSEDYQQYYRAREKDGEYEYDWHSAASNETRTQDETTPRDPVDSLTDEIQALSTESNEAESGYSLDPASGANAEQTSYSYSSKGKSSKSSSHKYPKGKGKGISHAGEEDEPPQDPPPLDPFFGARYQTGLPGESGGDPRYGSGYAYPETPDQPTFNEAEPPGDEGAEYVGEKGGGYHKTGHRTHRSSRRTHQQVHFDNEDATGADEENDPDLLAAIRRSRQSHMGYGGGESSSDAYVQYDPDDEGPPTPKGSKPAFDINGTGGFQEPLDPRYVVEPSHKFQPGEIFKVLWSEPTGAIGGTPTLSDKREYRDTFGESFYVGFRRFIVIANDEGHCTCVPILTYGGKGCRKKGVKPPKHGIIQQHGHKVRLLEGEPKLGFLPVRVNIFAEGEKLAKESRVNYSKLVTVEHNVKVFFIGHIIPEDWDTVSEAVNKCWEDKIHHQRKKFLK